MLTKTDLNQIRGVVSEEVDGKLEPIKKDLMGLKQDVGGLKQDMKYLKKKVNRIDKTLSLVVKNYDEADVKLQRRVKKIETHIGLTP